MGAEQAVLALGKDYITIMLCGSITIIYLFLINATSQNLDLRVAGSETVVIESTAAMQSGTRAVNPVNIGLSVVAAGSKTPLQTFQVDLRRGQNISFLATSSGVQLIEHRFGPVAK